MDWESRKRDEISCSKNALRARQVPSNALACPHVRCCSHLTAAAAAL